MSQRDMSLGRVERHCDHLVIRGANIEIVLCVLNISTCPTTRLRQTLTAVLGLTEHSLFVFQPDQHFQGTNQ